MHLGPLEIDRLTLPFSLPCRPSRPTPSLLAPRRSKRQPDDDDPSGYYEDAEPP